MSDPAYLSKRERQIMDVVHQQGEVSVADVLERLPDPSGYNSIRRLMTILEQKGHLQHRKVKNKYIYYATVQKEAAKRSALNHLLRTFFSGSTPKVVSTLLKEKDLTNEDLEELSRMIEEAKKDRADGMDH